MAAAAQGDLKPYAITNIKAYVPLTLDLSQLNYDAWRVLFETHCRAYGVAGFLDGSSTPTGDDDDEWTKLDSLVAMWIYGTLTQPLLTMVLKDGSSAHDVWTALQNLLRDNKDAKAIEFDNELRTLTQADRTITEYCQKLSSLADLLANIGSPVPAKTLMAHLLNGLNPRFDNIATVIRHSKPLPSLLEARSMLLLEENRMNRSRPSQPHHADHPCAPVVLHTTTDPPADRRQSDRRDDRRDDRRGSDRRQQHQQLPAAPAWPFFPPPWAAYGWPPQQWSPHRGSSHSGDRRQQSDHRQHSSRQAATIHTALAGQNNQNG